MQKDQLALKRGEEVTVLDDREGWWMCENTARKKSGNIFRVGIFLDFVRLTTRAPHGAHVRRAERNRIDCRSHIILPLFFRPARKGMRQATSCRRKMSNGAWAWQRVASRVDRESGVVVPPAGPFPLTTPMCHADKGCINRGVAHPARSRDADQQRVASRVGRFRRRAGRSTVTRSSSPRASGPASTARCGKVRRRGH